jgi:hypothetical protein
MKYPLTADGSWLTDGDGHPIGHFACFGGVEICQEIAHRCNTWQQLLNAARLGLKAM